MTKVFKKITALAMAAVTAGALGLSASAEQVNTYKWKAVKETYYGAPTSAGSRPDSANFYYSPNGYITNLSGMVHTSTNSKGSLTVSCTCSYAQMTSLRMEEKDIGEPLSHKVTVTDTVTYGIPFTYTAFTNTPGDTLTATGETHISSK